MKYKKLEKIILSKGLNLRELARQVGLRRIVLYAKIRGIVEFKAWEIINISKVLGLSENEIAEIFFGGKVS